MIVQLYKNVILIQHVYIVVLMANVVKHQLIQYVPRMINHVQSQPQ
jgi:hypothetical protein